MTRDLRLYVRDEQLRTVTILDRYETAEVVPKFNPVSLETCGTLEVSGIAVDSRAGRALLAPGAGINVSLDGKRFFTSLVESQSRSRAGSSGARMSVFCYADDSLAAVREAWPVPGQDSLAAQDAQEADTWVGEAAGGIRHYLRRNLAAEARTSSRVPLLEVPAGSSLGRRVVGRGRFHNVAELVSGLALAGGELGWRILHDPALGRLVATVFAPRDRSAHARFSTQLRNMSSYELSTPKARLTDSVAAGGGQGTARRFARYTQPAAWYDYRGSFVDRRDVGGGADQQMTAEELARVEEELQQAAQEAVLGAASASTFNFVVKDTPAVGFLRPDNRGGYGPLDKVTVMTEGQKLVDVVRQVSIQRTSSGLDIKATVGGPNAKDSAMSSAFAGVIKRMVDQERRLARLERSQ